MKQQALPISSLIPIAIAAMLSTGNGPATGQVFVKMWTSSKGGTRQTNVREKVDIL